MIFSINTYSIEWKKLYSDSKSDIYIIDKVIQKKEIFFYIKIMVNYLEPIYSKSTVLMKLKLDCKKSRIAILRKNFYVEKSYDHFSNRSFNKGNLLSVKVENELVKKICQRE
tara:strand:+ start:80 stop:415 length:336 start_codon:yes stop_codon:yes gene_type:complete